MMVCAASYFQIPSANTLLLFPQTLFEHLQAFLLQGLAPGIDLRPVYLTKLLNLVHRFHQAILQAEELEQGGESAHAAIFVAKYHERLVEDDTEGAGMEAVGDHGVGLHKAIALRAARCCAWGRHSSLQRAPVC